MERRLPRSSIRVLDWGRRDYASAFAAQRELQAAVIAGTAPDTLVLVEHDPVLTVTPRAAAAGHVLLSPRRLEAMGIAVHETDRGGDVTYHGPGQLVAYPILRLSNFGLNLSRHMRLLERVAIDTAAAFGVEARRDPPHTGVWVDAPVVADGIANDDATPSVPAKLCAMGVRIRRNVTMHGLAFNGSPDLSHFATIVPCGLADRAVTSLEALLGDDCPALSEIGAVLTDAFDAAISRDDAAAVVRAAHE